MKTFMKYALICTIALVVSGSSAFANPYLGPHHGGPLLPIADPHHGAIYGEIQQYPEVRLYDRVKVHFPKRVAPCAVEKIVAVPDPCDPCQCVLISICVPAYACENVIVHPKKDRVTFDYGKYQVRVTERGGKLHVAYFN